MTLAYTVKQMLSELGLNDSLIDQTEILETASNG